MSDLVVIGGGGAGLTAAFTARKINPKVTVTLISSTDVTYSPCALPFVVGGEIPSFDAIVEDLALACKKSGIRFVHDSAKAIDIKEKTVDTEKSGRFKYDSLVIATGGFPTKPPIKGIDKENIFTLYSIEDGKRILEKAKKSKHAVVVGGGAIGLESVVALRELGLHVTLVEGFPHVLSRFFDPEYCEIIEAKFRSKGVDIVLGSFVEEITGGKEVKGVKVAGREIPADLIIMAAGVKPDARLAEKAGLALECGGIKTDWMLQSSAEGVYAVGDCACSKSMITHKPGLSMLGTTAVRHGTIAGMNSVGESVPFEGILGSMALKLFDLKIGRIGLTENEAKEDGREPVCGRMKSTTKAKYYADHEEVDVKLIFSAADRRIVGAQVIGGAVTKKVDLVALAIAKRATVEDILGLGYSYTPPLAPSHNVIVMAAENAYRKLKRKETERKKRF
jgi:NADH oxidase (H2O2-forming)